jgi:hypothetical protein
MLLNKTAVPFQIRKECWKQLKVSRATIPTDLVFDNTIYYSCDVDSTSPLFIGPVQPMRNTTNALLQLTTPIAQVVEQKVLVTNELNGGCPSGTTFCNRFVKHKWNGVSMFGLVSNYSSRYFEVLFLDRTICLNKIK